MTLGTRNKRIEDPRSTPLPSSNFRSSASASYNQRYFSDDSPVNGFEQPMPQDFLGAGFYSALGMQIQVCFETKIIQTFTETKFTRTALIQFMRILCGIWTHLLLIVSLSCRSSMYTKVLGQTCQIDMAYGNSLLGRIFFDLSSVIFMFISNQWYPKWRVSVQSPLEMQLRTWIEIVS